MKLLATLPTVPREDSAELKALYPEAARGHRRRMRLSLAVDILSWAIPPHHRAGTRVFDPMFGCGTSYLAARLLGMVGATGLDHDREMAKVWEGFRATEGLCVVCKDSRLEAVGYPQSHVLLTSPPFPNSHSEGTSEKQDKITEDKNLLSGGQDFDMMRLWRTKAAYIGTLALILEEQAPLVIWPGYFLVHIRNHVEKAKEVRVDLWTKQAMEEAGLDVLGYLAAPLGYTSFFQEIQKMPLRKVESRVYLTGGLCRDTMECGHSKERSDQDTEVKHARCKDCDPLERDEVTEDRIIVGMMK